MCTIQCLKIWLYLVPKYKSFSDVSFLLRACTTQYSTSHDFVHCTQSLFYALSNEVTWQIINRWSFQAEENIKTDFSAHF